MTERRLTFRCVVCAENWPYYEGFRTCPICGEECKPLRLDTPSTYNDHIMDWEEACHRLELLGLAGPCQAKPKRAKVDKNKLIAELRADLERWAEEAPHWLKH